MALDAVIREFSERYARRVLLLDSNLLLLLIATRLGPAPFGHFKRVDFSFDDGLLLIAIASQFRTVLTTPAVLTEASNLGGYAPDHAAFAFRQLLAQWLTTARDVLPVSLEITKCVTYPGFGFADATIARLTETENAVAMTADTQLYLHLESLELPCLNFRHVQAARLLG